MANQLSDVRSVAANTTVENVLAGKLGEFVQQDSRIRIAITASAAGMLASVIIGNQVIMDGQEISDVNRFPQDPEDFLINTAALRNDRLIIKLNNTTAGAITARTVVKIEPV